MIGWMHGKIIRTINHRVIINVHDIGYTVFVPYDDLKQESIESFYIYHHIREDANVLYGFKTQQELELFSLLITVSGIGPKSGLSIMSALPANTIIDAIVSGNSSIFQTISGVGSRAAAKIIVELKGKMGTIDIDLDMLNKQSDLIDALAHFGYTGQDVRSVLQSLPKDLNDISAQVKWALKKIGKRK